MPMVMQMIILLSLSKAGMMTEALKSYVRLTL